MINCILYSISFIKSKSKAYRIFTVYLIFIFFIQIITILLNRKRIPNLFLSHYYFIGQYFLLTACFFYLFKKKAYKLSLLICLIFVSFFIVIFYTLNPEKYYSFNLIEIFLTSTPLIIFCFLYFIEKFEDISRDFLYIFSGFFIYILCSTLLFATGDIGSIHKVTLWSINALIYLLYQVLIFFEWYKHFRKPKVKRLR